MVLHSHHDVSDPIGCFCLQGLWTLYTWCEVVAQLSYTQHHDCETCTDSHEAVVSRLSAMLSYLAVLKVLRLHEGQSGDVTLAQIN